MTLAGVSKARMRSWVDQGLITVKVTSRTGSRVIRQFTLDEAVQAMLVARMQDKGVPYGRIRRAVMVLRDEGYDSPLRQVVWGVEDKHLFFQRVDGSWADGHVPDQLVIRESIDLEEIRATLRRVPDRGEEDAGRVVRRRGVKGSQPVFAGTRVPVEGVRRWLAAGASEERILAAYPSLTPSDVRAARVAN